MNAGSIIIKTKIDNKEFDKQIDELEFKIDQLQNDIELGKDWLDEQQLKEANAELEKMRNKLSSLKSQQLKGIEGSFNNVGKSIGKSIKSILKMGLAIFSIRTAYSAVRSAISSISEYNEDMANKLAYAKALLVTAIEPVVVSIVNLFAKLIGYLGYLISAWTGRNIFAETDKNLKSSTKSAKELQKTMAGFDEMNTAGASSSSGGTSGVSSIIPQEGETPEWLETIKNIGEWIINNWEDVVGGLLLTKLFIDLITGNWIGLFIDAIGFIILAFFQVKDAFIDIWDGIKVIAEAIGNWVYEKVIQPIANFFSNLWQGIKDGVSNAVQWVKDKFHSIIDFFSNLISKIVGLFKKIGTKVGDVIGGAFKAVINGVLSAIENILNTPIKQVNNLLDKINEVPGINIKKLTTFNLPRLAKGGIVNMPGRGVPIGSALAGERGAEGVIPLTDSQQMELLGEAIGRYITINANITNQMNGRTISRELVRIQNQNGFANNGGVR